MKVSEEKSPKLPTFAERFFQLRGSHRTQAEFADFLGIARPTVGFYENGDRLPDAAVLKKICERCNCSCDWLLGLSDCKTTDLSVRAVCTQTGLSEKAIKQIEFYKTGSPISLINVLNALLEDAVFWEALNAAYVSERAFSGSQENPDPPEWLAHMKTKDLMRDVGKAGLALISKKSAYLLYLQEAQQLFYGAAKAYAEKVEVPAVTDNLTTGEYLDKVGGVLNGKHNEKGK